jgi:hypothetical protein
LTFAPQKPHDHAPPLRTAGTFTTWRGARAHTIQAVRFTPH